MNERTIIDGLVQTLQTLPDACVDLRLKSAERGGADASIVLRLGDRQVTLAVEARPTLFPRDAREFLWRAAAGQGDTREPRPVPMVAANTISPAVRALLRERRCGYYDTGGSLYVPIDGAYVLIERPPPEAPPRTVSSPFTDRRANVVHALLLSRDAWHSVMDLARLAHVSSTTASQVLATLVRFDWVDERGAGPGKQRRLREPGALLDGWAAHLATQRPPDVRRYYVPGTKTDALMDRLGVSFDAGGIPHAVSFEAAAQRYAPYLSSVSQVRAWVETTPKADDALAMIDARPVTEGANLTMLASPSGSELLFRQRAGEAWLASPVRVYLDLLRGEGRAKEAATHLRRERLGF